MGKPSSKIMPYLAAGAAVGLWASSFPGVKYCLKYYSPQSIMLLRFLVASASLGIYGLFTRMGLPRRKDLPAFALSAFVGLFAYMWLFNTGTAYVQSGVSSFIISASPVFVLLMTAWVLKEPMTPAMVIGVLISLVGLVTVSIGQVSGIAMNLGHLLLIAAAICSAVYTVTQRRLVQQYSPIRATTYTVVLGTVFMLVFLPALVQELPRAPWQANGVLVFLGVFPAALAYLLWGYALSGASSTLTVTSFAYLTPFLAALLAHLWLGESLSPLAWLGGGVIIGGMAFTSAFRRARA